jgi:hypothetical protein
LQLHKCLQVPNKPETFTDIDHNSIDLNHDLTYWERPICILGEDVHLTIDARSRCIRCNGVTIPKTRPLGNVRIISDENFLNYFTLSYRISGQDSFKGGRSVTPHFL